MLHELEELVRRPGDILFRGQGDDHIVKGDEIYLYREDRISVCMKIIRAKKGFLTGIVTKLDFGDKDSIRGLAIGDKVTTHEQFVFMVSHRQAA